MRPYLRFVPGDTPEAIAQLAIAFGEARDPARVFEALTLHLLQTTPANGLIVTLLDEATRMRKCVYAWSDGEVVDVAKLPLLALTDSPHSRAVKTGEVVVVDDFDAAMKGQPRIDITVRDPRLPKSAVVVPMVAHGRVLGAFEIQSLLPAAFTPHDVGELRLVANLAGLAIENVRLLDSQRAMSAELERKVGERTRQLQGANRELEAFSYTVAHDLRSPLLSVEYLAKIVMEDNKTRLDDESTRTLAAIAQSTRRMSTLVNDLLAFARSSRGDLQREAVDVTELARAVVDALVAAEPGRRAEVSIDPGLRASADSRLLRVVLDNLVANAWKFSAKKDATRIHVGELRRDGERAFFVRDEGAGFEPEKASRLFVAFQRLHAPGDFEGTGIGLATVARIVERHGGRVWAEGAPGKGATFWFTLGEGSEPSNVRVP